jgi:DNA-directed RNA polymerase subunit K/omega
MSDTISDIDIQDGENIEDIEEVELEEDIDDEVDIQDGEEDIDEDDDEKDIKNNNEDDEEEEEVNYDDEEENIDDEIYNLINGYNNVKKTFPIMTSFEKNYILGLRTQQIINGSVVLIDINKIDKKSLTPYNIACEELKQNKIPLKIKRKLPNGTIEIWDVKDLIVFN